MFRKLYSQFMESFRYYREDFANYMIDDTRSNWVYACIVFSGLILLGILLYVLDQVF